MSAVRLSSSEATTRTVQQTTVDDYVRENNIARLNWLKIDVEGAELDVPAWGNREH